jgi:hypothetical protein
VRVSAFVACLTLASAGATRADAQGDPARSRRIELDNLRTPTSPAFTILGVAPTAVARPMTPRALALELLSQAENASAIPDDYALEVAPYWLRPRPTLSFKAYTEPDVAQSLRQSFAVSFATSRADTTADTQATDIALGVRASPNAGRPSRKFNALLASLDSMQRARLPLVRGQADILDELDALGGGQPQTRAVLRARLAAAERALASQADSIRVIATTIGEQEAERVGLFTELAVALAATYPSNRFEGGRLGRVGAWGALSYRMEAPRLDVIALARFQRDFLALDENSLDVGGRLYWLDDRLGISAELVNRTAFQLGAVPTDAPTVRRTLTFESSNRLVGTVDYRASDALYVSLSFGHDHQAPGVDGHPLVAVLAVSFQWGDKPIVLLEPLLPR